MADQSLAFERVFRANSPTVVFLHGFLGAKEDWHVVIEALGASYDTIAIDLPGHGASVEIPDDLFAFDRCSEAIAELLTMNSIGSYNLVGYSMGGRVALHHALKYAKQIQSLVVISANPGIESDNERSARAEADKVLAGEIRSKGLAWFVERWYAQQLFAPLRQSLDFEKIQGRRASGSVNGLSRALESFSVGLQKSRWDALSTLKMPVLAIAGELDRKYAAIAARIADLCPRGKQSIISGAGHAVHLERPQELARAVQAVIESCG